MQLSRFATNIKIDEDDYMLYSLKTRQYYPYKKEAQEQLEKLLDELNKGEYTLEEIQCIEKLMKKGKYIDWNILKRSMDHELSEEEKNTFENWYASHESHRNYYERMISEWNRETLRERNLSRILSKYDSLLQTRERCHLQVIRRRILYWSVAAVLFIGFGVAWIIEGFQSKVISPIPFTAIVPGQSKAYLSLYDGTNICLDEI